MPGGGLIWKGAERDTGNYGSVSVVGLASVILGTASGAQNVGIIGAFRVDGYIPFGTALVNLTMLYPGRPGQAGPPIARPGP